MYMLGLVGYRVSRAEVTLQIPDDEWMTNIRNGRDTLRDLTGEDFGYDLSAWHNFLAANKKHGYTHPYARRKVDEAVLLGITAEKRNQLVALLEKS